MAEGTLAFYDDSIGRGRIETSSGKYSVRAEDMSTDARVQGAIVSFDIERVDDPLDRAINVTLREGTRNHTDQHRFGHNP